MLTDDQKAFLISLKNGDPQWDILDVKNVEKLPAIQWKLRNIQALRTKNPQKHSELVKKLKTVLNLG